LGCSYEPYHMVDNRTCIEFQRLMQLNKRKSSIQWRLLPQMRCSYEPYHMVTLM